MFGIPDFDKSNKILLKNDALKLSINMKENSLYNSFHL